MEEYLLRIFMQMMALLKTNSLLIRRIDGLCLECVNPVSKAEADEGASIEQKTIPISSILSTAFYHD
jgi:hypothetical protein